MNDLIIDKFNTYPEDAKALAYRLRDLLYEVASSEGIDHIEESLKWGEPCFKAKDGSPIRIDWKARSPENIYIFFICSTKLVETFKELYGEHLDFEGNRAIVLKISDEQPTIILKHCVSLAMRYHKIKNLPYLGV